MESLLSIFYYIGYILGRILKYSLFPIWDIYLQGFYNGRISKRLRMYGTNSRISRKARIVNPNYVSIGNDTVVADYCLIEVVTVRNLKNKSCTAKAPSIDIGTNCTIGSFSHISCSNRISIGDGVLTGKFCLIIDNSHGYNNGTDCHIPPEYRDITSKGPVIIEKNVWIADKVAILPGVTIGEGSIIASNAVVTHDIPPFSIAAGIPAKVIRFIKSGE